MKRWLELLALFVVAVAFQFCVRHLAGMHMPRLAFWPMAGLYLAALTLRPPRQWPEVIAALLGAMAFTDLVWGGELSRFFADAAVGTALATMTGAFLLRRAGWPRSVDLSYRSQLFFLLCGSLLVPLINVSLRAVNLGVLRGQPTTLDDSLIIFASDGLGILTISPLLFAASETWNRRRDRLTKRRIFGDLCRLAVVAAVGAGVVSLRDHALSFLIFPAVIWVAMRGSMALTAAANVIVGLTSLYASVAGRGGEPGNVVQAQLFLAVTVLSAAVMTLAIAGRRKAQAELTRAEARAQAASEAKSRFLAGMSHEIRSPLTALIGFAELLLDNDPPPAERREHLGIIKRNGQHLLALINEILDLAKIESGRLETTLAPVSLRELLADVDASLALAAKAKNLHLSWSVADSVPALLLTDPLRLKQILLNAVGNAVKFTAAGFVRIEAMARIADDGRLSLRVTVQDTGVGMTEADRQRLFQPFSQGTGSERNFGGTGLGLVLSRRLARILGGDFVLDWSEPGVGSRFRLEILAAALPNPVAEDADRAPIPITRVNGMSLKGLTILVADDAPDNRLLVSRVLEASGALVHCVDDGLKAVESAGARRYDCVLMDLQMPVLRGDEATQRLRAGGYDRPIVALSAHAMAGDAAASIAGGFDGHLAKPIDRARLIATVAALARAPALAVH